MGSAQQLLRELVKLGLIPSAIRELLHAAIGLKVSRITVSDHLLPSVISAVESCGLHVGVSSDKYFACPDMGKGGWCNAPPLTLKPDSPIGEHFIYVGLDSQKVLRAMESEECGSNLDFAECLGIPDCCAEFFVKNADAALSIQNDFMLFTYKNSLNGEPFDHWINLASQYFGFSLISFFPCSFHCAHAAEVAKHGYFALESIDSHFAKSFLAAQKCDYFYTEYDGVFQFSRSEFDGRVLQYDPSKIRSTSQGIIASILRRGNAIEKLDDKHHIILRGHEVLMDIEDDLSFLLVFSNS